MLEGKRDGWKALIALLPAMFFLTIFIFFPIVNTFLLSFMDNFAWAPGAGLWLFGNTFDAFPSFGNYVAVLSDATFVNAVINTAILVIVSVPLTIIVSLLLAVALHNIKALKGLYQTIFFLPYVTNAIALGMVFNVMFSKYDSGLMNQFLGLFGMTPQNWVGADGASKFNMAVVMVVSSLWNGLAFKVLVFMAGLASIDKQYYDAARIDGANRTRIFSKITVPLLSPQIFYITITSFIGAFKMYTSVISIFGAGPFNFGGSDGNTWITIVGYVYKVMRIDTGKAAAGSMTLLIIILIITGIQFLVGKKRVHY
ncbi:MAG TPA: sugar ABC transporter permease [Bacilli bacterium]|jgi:multiple sugar transport system permease protein|nr:sugar ABC transporter permease [Bacilli bacterium]